ncbi:type VI secretion system protein TssA [Paraburkholderia sp. BR10954]|uniref:type VI secretion system protein TssA n=1 Tax=Paraburkholderia sp. BR10954 TaxID=3236995 RepID=UPI0034D37AFD
MKLFDPDNLLRPVDDHSATGENLEYDPEFITLEQIATPTSERAIGDSLKAAVEPDWDRVASAAESLFSRTNDLRVAIHLMTASTRIHGIAGWCAGLGLVRGLLERYWDEVHPRLDADDDNDVTARSNAIRPLGDSRSVLGYFRNAPFVTSPRLGRFSLRDLRIATGAINPTPSAEGVPPPTLPELEACCMDCPADQLPDASATLARAQDHARAIAAIASEKLGAAGPDLNPLCGDIEELKKFVDTQLSRRFPERGEAHISGLASAVEDARGEHPLANPGPQRDEARNGERIQGPDDIVLRLDEICEYYEHHEPSSPLPVLLKRARRLVGKSFAEVIKNVAPGGLAELQTLAGPEEE